MHWNWGEANSAEFQTTNIVDRHGNEVIEGTLGPEKGRVVRREQLDGTLRYYERAGA